MPYARGDRKLHITFNELGHGDSVLISLPNGAMVMIDCGSMRWDRNYFVGKPPVERLRANAFLNALRDARFLLNNREIDVLILTHPDQDHCNELNTFFNTTVTQDGRDYRPPTRAKRCYFSNEFKEYEIHGVPGVLWTSRKAQQLFSVTINAAACSRGLLTAYDRNGPVFDTNAPNGGAYAASADGTAELNKKSSAAFTRNFVKILDGTAPRRNDADNDVVDCGFYLLASNVVPYEGLSDGCADDSNRRSLVTAVVYGDKKFLFLGDATFHTERFLIDTYGEALRNVEMVHVGHHASYKTSSSFPAHPVVNPELNFVGHVNPQYAVVTAAWDSGQALGLPRYEVIERYHNGARMLRKPDDMAQNLKQLACYKKAQASKEVQGGSGKKKQKLQRANEQQTFDAFKHVWCTGSHGPIDFDYGVRDGRVVSLPPDG